MTLPPEKLGDQGQRYVVQTTGYPDPEKKGWQDIGFTNSRDDALAMMRGIAQAPSVGHVQIVDRQPDVLKIKEGDKTVTLTCQSCQGKNERPLPYDMVTADKCEHCGKPFTKGPDPEELRRKHKFERMQAQTDKGWERATIYGIEIGSMSPEELKIAFGWAMTELRKLRGQ